MQHLDEHMDELFQKAAEAYPLSTGTSGWDAIASRVAGAPVAAGAEDVAGRRKRSRISRLFFAFTGMTVVVLLFYFSTGKDYLLQGARTAAAVRPVVAAGAGTATSTPAVIAGSTPEPVLKHAAGITTQPGWPGNNKLSMPVWPGPFDPVIRVGQPMMGTSTDIMVQPARIALPETPAAPEKKEDKKKQHAFYLGIGAGLQMNEVSGQGFTKTALQPAVLIGYRWSKRLSVETGLSFSKRRYYSGGSYFDMTKVASSMPANMTLLSMNGSVAVFELPVKLKYDFSVGARASWFVSSGMSSFLLTRESNDYLAMVNGAKQQLQGDYRQSFHYFPAAADFCAGYELKTGKQSMLRIEPYWQIPLKGIGIGSMHVVTTGINIEFTSSFHK